MNRFALVRELVKDPSLRVTEIAWKTGYNKGHVSRLRKESIKQRADYERGVVDGMQRQMQSSVDRAINRMTKEDIIKLAQEAISLKMEDHVWTMSTTHLERFAALVAAAEREACAKLVEADGLARGSEGLVLIKAAGRIRARGEK